MPVLVYTVNAAQIVLRHEDPRLKMLLCFQEDPEWTAEKELCQRKGIPYQAPKKKVRPLIACMTAYAVSDTSAAPCLLVLFHR